MPYIGNSPGTGTRNRYIYTATASQTTFSGADDNGKTLAYADSDYVDVFLNGICLVPVDDYTATSKTSIVLTVGAAADDTLEVIAYDIATIADTVSKANGGTFEGSVGIGVTSPAVGYLGKQSLDVEGPVLSRGPINSHQTDAAVLEYNSDIAYIRSYGATSSSGEISFRVGGGGGTADAEAMRIDSSGNLLVGTTTNPDSRKFRVYGIAEFDGSGISLINHKSSGTKIGSSGQGNYVVSGGPSTGYGIQSQSHLVFGSGGTTERMRIDSNGSLLVGKTSGVSNAVLQLGGSSSKHSLRMENSYGSGNDPVCIINNQTNATYQPFVFENGGTNRGSIQTTTSGTNYYTSSDYRLKENIVDLTGAIDRLQQLEVKRFNFIGDGDMPTVDGFLAHEAQTVVPEAVSGTHDGMRDEEYEVTPAVLDDDGNVVTEAVMGTRSVPDYQGIDQAKLVPLLTAALQEAIAKIEDLETRVAALEAN